MKQHIIETFNELGKMFGTGPLYPNEHDVLTLEIEDNGLMFIELCNDLIFVYLTDNFYSTHKKIYTTMLTICQPHLQQPPIIIHPIMVDGVKLGFLVKFHTEDFTLPNVDIAIKMLIEKMEIIKQMQYE